MSNIYKAFNVKNDTELTKFIESLELDSNQEIELYSYLNESMSIEGIRYISEALAQRFDNGSYEKLKEQFSKPPFIRTLKESKKLNTSMPEELKYSWEMLQMDYNNLDWDDDIFEMYHSFMVFFRDIHNVYRNDKDVVDLCNYAINFINNIIMRQYEHYCDLTGEFSDNYDSFEESVENGSNEEFLECMDRGHQQAVIEEVMKFIENFIEQNKERLLNNKEIKAPDNSGEDYLEEAKNDSDEYIREICKFIEKIKKKYLNKDINNDEQLIAEFFIDSLDVFEKLMFSKKYSNTGRVLYGKCQEILDEEFRNNCNDYAEEALRNDEYEDLDDILSNSDYMSIITAYMNYNGRKNLLDRLKFIWDNFLDNNSELLIYDEDNKKPDETGEDYLEEQNLNERLTDRQLVSVGSLMEEFKEIFKVYKHPKCYGEMFEENNDIEDYVYENIFFKMLDILYSLSKIGYAPAERGYERIKERIKKTADEDIDYNMLDDNEMGDDAFDVNRFIQRCLDNNELDKLYYKFSLSGKIYDLEVLHTICQQMYHDYKLSDDEIFDDTLKPENIGDEEYVEEGYDINKEPIFDIGDNVSFKWGNKEITGRIINVSTIGNNNYFDIISWNNEKKRRETYTRVCPVSNEMKKIIEGE